MFGIDYNFSRFKLGRYRYLILQFPVYKEKQHLRLETEIIERPYVVWSFPIQNLDIHDICVMNFLTEI